MNANPNAFDPAGRSPQNLSAVRAMAIARQRGSALKALVEDAIEKFEIAYQAVWAIDTGQTTTPDLISQVHKRIREFLKRPFGDVRGGSVCRRSAGLLIEGASLKAETFLPIICCLDGN